ncbi:MAG: hypothetical protein QM770_10950 [Tepidisphaeraceae bacterium]
MPNEIRTKKTFGTCYASRISPPPAESSPRSVNIVISFEEALKLHLSIGQALAKLNSYNRSTTAGKRSAMNICLYQHDNYITVNEAKITPPDSAE